MTSLRRYTNLAATMHLLRTRTITLLNPATWDDQNDAYFMAEYKRLINAKTVLALCFAESTETYHHWRIFSHGCDGVCIEFDKDRMLSTFEGDSDIRQGAVRYKLIREIEKSIRVEELPFLKRRPYRNECEYRVVFVSPQKALQHQDYFLQINWIRRITLSPWMSQELAKSVKAILTSIDGCSKIKIARSTLVNNEAWKMATTRVATSSHVNKPGQKRGF